MNVLIEISANEKNIKYNYKIISITPLVQQYWLYRKLLPMPSKYTDCL